MTFVNNLKDVFASERSADEGDALVSWVLLTAGLALATVLTVRWFSTAILNKVADTASCIEGSQTYSTDSSATEKACNTSYEDKNSFKNDSGFTSRFK